MTPNQASKKTIEKEVGSNLRDDGQKQKPRFSVISSQLVPGTISSYS